LIKHSITTMCKFTNEYCDLCQMAVGSRVRPCSKSSSGWMCADGRLPDGSVVGIKVRADSAGNRYVYIAQLVNKTDTVIRCEDCVEDLKRSMHRTKSKSKSKSKGRSRFASLFM